MNVSFSLKFILFNVCLLYLNKVITMKNTSPFLYITITTLLLITITIMCAMNFPFNWVFYLTVIGQFLVVIMVYKVLTDNYSTNKTFEDFYEDCPIKLMKIQAENEKFR